MYLIHVAYVHVFFDLFVNGYSTSRSITAIVVVMRVLVSYGNSLTSYITLLQCLRYCKGALSLITTFTYLYCS